MHADFVDLLNEDEDDIDFLENDHSSTSLRDVPSDLQDQLDKADLGKHHQHSPRLAIANCLCADAELKHLGLHEIPIPYEASEELGRGSFATILELPWEHSNLTVGDEVL